MAGAAQGTNAAGLERNRPISGAGTPFYWSLCAIGLALVLVVLCRTAWLCDDSYITFRTIDNFVHGYGLRWNIDERVQAYTHPLWLIVMLLGRVISGEVYWTALLLNVASSISAVGLFAYAMRGRTGALALGIAAFVSSRAFIDFSTSGLENALSHLLLGGFLLTYWSEDVRDRTRSLGISTGLLLLNRLDLAVLAGAPLLGEWIANRGSRRAAAIWLVAPLCLWEAFSLLYYGFLFPNTAYAKLNTGVPKLDLARQGFYYFSNSLRHDPATLVVIGGAIVVTMIRRQRRDLVLLAGVLAYLAYVVWIGGDFMTGRFLAAPLYVGVWLLARPVAASTPLSRPCLAGVAIVAISFLGPYTAPIASGRAYGQGDQIFDATLEDRGINDERRFYFPYTGMLRADRRRGVPVDHPWAEEGRRAGLTGVNVVVRGNVGFYGYMAGPDVHIIDYYALAEPLLARLPAKKRWRIGHFVRIMPAGYTESAEAKANRIADPDLATYEDHLRLITSGPIWSWARLRMIVHMNLGRDEALLARYVERLRAAGYQ
jgi:arabinofuranosyltransferase